MHHIWDFLGFTISAALVGLFLLLVKAVFHDKLTARWHYLIWTVLLVRLLVPVQNTIFTSPLSLLGSIQFPQYLSLLQMKVEQRLNSVFSQPYTALGDPAVSDAMLQWKNYSVTDWLFVVYIIGVVVLTLFYTIIYIHLRCRIYKGQPADQALRTLVSDTAVQYNVKPCRNIRICSGFDTPFVCGILRPVLVIPIHLVERIDAMMILHELLHLQYKDIWMNFLIHAVRILNWCNPVMWFILNRIQNDSEAFCDQRVLERIEKEQHREYGYHLLDLARSKYPTVVGTTTMANGKRNIKRRLKRIVDFRYVPSGHGVAAFCITLLLSMACVANAEVPRSEFDTTVSTKEDMKQLLRNAQLYQVQTPEEAVNIFCKALEDSNMGYMALVVPPEDWNDYEQWVWEISKTGTDGYAITLGERAFGPNERPILNADNTYAYHYRDLRITNPYFFFEDGELYRPIERAEIGYGCIIQNLYPIDKNTWRCQAIWDYQRYEILDSVYFDLVIQKTYDWNIEILGVQRVKTPADLKNVNPSLRNFQPEKWPVLASQSYEDDNWKINLQHFNYGGFRNLDWDPWNEHLGYQRELDREYCDTTINLVFKNPVIFDTKTEIFCLSAEDDINDISDVLEQNRVICDYSTENVSAGSHNWHYSSAFTEAGEIPKPVYMGGGGTGTFTPESLHERYRVLIYENGILTADILLEQEAMLYE